MQRYFVNKEQFTKDDVVITGDDAHHMIKVLRYHVGDKIICSNGEGLDIIAEITGLEKEKVICKRVSLLEENREPGVHIILAQALPKSDKMDLIIQKGTEIGISSFIPFTSIRTIVQLNDKKEQKRMERWEKIAKEAAEQSHRSKVPVIKPVVSLKEMLSSLNEDQLILIAYEKETGSTLFEILNQQRNWQEIVLIIGPEGGFTEEEVEVALSKGAKSISLGKRILRTETAGMVGAANIIYHIEGNKF